MKNKNVLLLFTGGLDSTYLLLKNIKAGNNVTCVYTKILNNTTKTDVEYFCAKNIVRLIEDSNKIYIPFITNVVELNGRTPPDNPQILINLFMAAFTSIGHKDFDEVQIAYVPGDVAISYIEDMKDIFKKYKKIFGHFENKTKLKFPLFKTHKAEFISRIPHNLLKYINSCENLDSGKTHTCSTKSDHSSFNICNCCLQNLILYKHHGQNAAKYLLNKTIIRDNMGKVTDIIYDGEVNANDNNLLLENTTLTQDSCVKIVNPIKPTIYASSVETDIVSKNEVTLPIKIDKKDANFEF